MLNLFRIALVAGVLVVFSCATPAIGLTTDDAREIARNAGVPPEVGILVVEDARPNGVYGDVIPGTPDGSRGIVLFQPDGFPDAWMRVILYHEIAHYWQEIAGTLGSPTREWGADLDGLAMACAAARPGRNPIDDFRDLWVWLMLDRDIPSYEYGRGQDRVYNVLTSRRCELPGEAL